MKSALKTVFPVLFLISFSVCLAQEKSALKKISKVEKEIKKDNYKKAIKKGLALEKKLDKANLHDSIDFLLYEKINRAYYLNGNVSNSLKYLDLAGDAAEKTGSFEQDLPLIRLMVFNHQFGKAAKSIEALYSVPGFSKTAESDLLLHLIYLKTGEINKALEIENQLVTDMETARTLTKNMSKKELAAFFENYYRTQLQKAMRMEEQGAQQEAYLFLHPLHKDVMRHISRKSDFRYEYLAFLGKLAMEGNDIELAEDYYDRALDEFTGNHKAHHPQGIRLLANCLQIYNYLGKDRKLLDQTKKYYPQMSYYKSQRSSVNTLPLLLTDIERKASAGSFREADRSAAQIYELAQRYQDKCHPALYDLNTNLYQYFISRDKFSEASVCGVTKQKISKGLLGESSPGFAVEKLNWAQHIIVYEFNKEGLNEFNSPSWERYESNYGKKHPRYLVFLNAQAQAYGLNDQMERQISLLEQASKVAEEYYGQDFIWARQQIILAEAHLNAGSFNLVTPLVNQALPIVEKAEGKNSLFYLSGSRVLAENYENTGKADEALAIYKKTFRKLDRLSRRAGVSSFSQPEKLAQVYMLSGEYEDAEKLLQRSLQQKNKIYGSNARSIFIEPLVLLAKVKFLRGNYIEAQQQAQKAIEIGKQLGNENTLKILQANKLLADIDFAIGDYKAASSRLAGILDRQVALLGTNNPEVANTTLQFAQANYFAFGKAEENLKKVEAAIGIYRNTVGGSSLALANALVYQGLFLMELEKNAEALITLDEARQIYAGQLSKGNISEAKILRLEGDILYRERKFTESEKKYAEAAKLYRQLFDSNHPEYLKCQSKIARAKTANGEYADALAIAEDLTANYLVFVDEMFPYLSEREKSKYWNQLKNDFELYYGLVNEVAPGNQSRLQKVFEYRLKTKALLLNSSVKFQSDVKAAHNDSTTELFNTWLTQRQQLASVIALSKAEQQEAGINAEEMAARADDTEKQLAAELYKNGDSGDKSPSVKTISKKLSSNDLLVEVLRYPSVKDPQLPQYSFMVLDPRSSKISLVSVPGGQEMEGGYYNYYRNAVKLMAHDKYSYDTYWKALDEVIPDGRTVYFSPDGVYTLLNPETFKDTSGRFVIEKNQIVFLNNPGDLVKAAESSPMVKGAELVGDPAFYSSQGYKRRLKDLPGASEELASLKTVLSDKGYEVTSLTRENAREDSVKRVHSPGILHFATHGYFEDDDKPVITAGLREEEAGKHPLLQSGLILYNGGEVLSIKNSGDFYAREGILTAFEAKDMDLGNTDMVVLSACETGLGRINVGEGVYGLQRAFLDAGANSVLMSLFKVNDEATRDLMVAFYRNWLETGNKQKALTDAKKEIMTRYPDPIYWGSFVLVGS